MATAKQVLDLALSKEGISGRPNEFTDYFGMNDKWCAMFVTTILEKAGVKGMPHTACAVDFANGARYNGQGTYHSGDNYTPQPGDLFIHGYTGSWALHVGFVVSVIDGGVKTMEGNTSGASGGMAAQRTRYYSNYSMVFVTPPYDKESSQLSTTVIPEKEISVPSGLGKYYSYETWNREEHGYSAWVADCKKLIDFCESRGERHYDSDGYGMIGDRYVVAMTSTYGNVGDYVDITCADGRVIKAVIGDIKNQNDSGCNKWGHENGQIIVEFMTNWAAVPLHANPPSNGGIIKVANYGSYFDNPDYASGATETYMYEENAYADESAPVVVWNDRKAENICPPLNSAPELPEQKELAVFCGEHDITKYCGELSWSDSLEELSTSVSFTTAKTDAAYLKDLIYIPQVGDIVQIFVPERIFKGIITEADDGDKNSNKYSANDMGWYLNKTAQTYQFEDISAYDVLIKICEDLYIPVQQIAIELQWYIINRIYFDKNISDIIDDILSQCKGRFCYYFTPAGFNIVAAGSENVEPLTTVAGNVIELPAVEFMGNYKHSVDISDTKNSVKIVSIKDNTYREIMVKQNRESINQFGFLQEIISIDENTDASTVADNALAADCHAKETVGFDIICKSARDPRAGQSIAVGGITHLITATKHSIKDGRHYVTLEVER